MTALSYAHGVTTVPLLGETIGAHFDRTVRRWGDHPGLISCQQGIRWRWRELGEKVDAFAAGLVAMGLKPGERVGIWSPNNAEWIVTQYATAKAGLILVNINPAYRLSEVEYALNKVGCRALVTATRFKTSDYIGTGGYAVRKEKACKLTTGYDIDLRFPGYVAREIPGKELLAWNGNPAITSKLPAPKYEAKFWMEKGLAVSIQRPLFIKVLAVFCLLLALVSIPFVAFKSKPETYLVNCAAYFVGLWAVRGIIAVNAPKSPTIVDYVVLMLYCCQVLIVVGRVLWKTKAN